MKCVKSSRNKSLNLETSYQANGFEWISVWSPKIRSVVNTSLRDFLNYFWHKICKYPLIYLKSLYMSFRKRLVAYKWQNETTVVVRAFNIIRGNRGQLWHLELLIAEAMQSCEIHVLWWSLSACQRTIWCLIPVYLFLVGFFGGFFAKAHFELLIHFFWSLVFSSYTVNLQCPRIQMEKNVLTMSE